MRKIISIAVAAVMLVAMSLTFGGCGGEPANLQEYLDANPSLQEEMAESMKGFEDETMSVNVYAEGNCLVMTWHKDTYTPEQVDIMGPSFLIVIRTFSRLWLTRTYRRNGKRNGT